MVILVSICVIFFIYIVVVIELGGEERTIEFMEREGRASSKTPLLEHSLEKGTLKHVFPMNLFLKPWKLSEWVYQVIKFGIVQYVCVPSSERSFVSTL